jgi:hypothetical protein
MGCLVPALSSGFDRFFLSISRPFPARCPARMACRGPAGCQRQRARRWCSAVGEVEVEVGFSCFLLSLFCLVAFGKWLLGLVLSALCCAASPLNLALVSLVPGSCPAKSTIILWAIRLKIVSADYFVQYFHHKIIFVKIDPSSSRLFFGN